MQSIWCVVPAAGKGTRVGGPLPKQYLPIAGRSLLQLTLERLATHPAIAGLVVTLAAGDPHWPGLTEVAGKPVRTADGGLERYDSVLAGLDGLPPEVAATDFVLVHDAARPCVRHVDISRLIEQASRCEGGLLGAPLRDTLKRADDQSHSLETEPRDGRWRAFTPQMFRRQALIRALRQARADGVVVSDEAMAMERAGVRPLLVEGAEDNLKVTTQADFALAEFILSRAVQ